ncbi:unnamed protein product [Protopolystoma xenopodis]|uniref:Uncharacterized protein n=1 Tax=Protopolystoma xenopodis TaxID=117903 RepID=A0A3S5ACE6_9PLAT|nr:unnamed protein product [Protopolystoma xenopodis]
MTDIHPQDIIKASSLNILLQKRLSAALAEAASATDQLKASNMEFFELRERLAYSATERAYLKAAVEGLDEQVRFRHLTHRIDELNNE